MATQQQLRQITSRQQALQAKMQTARVEESRRQQEEYTRQQEEYTRQVEAQKKAQAEAQALASEYETAYKVLTGQITKPSGFDVRSNIYKEVQRQVESNPSLAKISSQDIKLAETLGGVKIYEVAPTTQPSVISSTKESKPFVGPMPRDSSTQEIKKSNIIKDVGTSISSFGAGIGNILKGQDFSTPVRTTSGTIMPSGSPTRIITPEGVEAISTTSGTKYVVSESVLKTIPKSSEIYKNAIVKKEEGTIYSEPAGTYKKAQLYNVYVIEDGKKRKATQEEQRYFEEQTKYYTLPEKKEGIQKIKSDIERASEELVIKKIRGEKISPTSEIKEFVGGAGLSLIGTGEFFVSAFTKPIETGKNILTSGKSILTGEYARTGELAVVSKTIKDRPAFALGYVSAEIGQIYLGSKVSKVIKEEFSLWRVPEGKTKIEIYKKPKITKTPLDYTFPKEIEFKALPSPEQRIRLWEFQAKEEAKRLAFLKKSPPIIKQVPIIFDIIPEQIKTKPIIFDIVSEPITKVKPIIKQIKEIKPIVFDIVEEVGVIKKPSGKTIKTIDFFKGAEPLGEQAIKTGTKQIQLLKPVQEVKKITKVITIQAPKVKQVQFISETSPLGSMLKQLQKQSQFQEISLSQVQRQKQEQKLLDSQIQLQPLVQLLKQKERVIQRQRYAQQELQAFKQKEGQIQLFKFAQPQAQAFKERQAFAQLFKYKQEYKQKEKLITKLKSPEIQRNYPLPTKQPTARERLNNLLEVFKKGKEGFIKVGETKTKEEAGKLIEKELLKGLEASAFAQEKATGRKVGFEELSLSNLFRPSKQKGKEFIAVQKEKKVGFFGKGRLTTLGERREIQRKRKEVRPKRIKWY